jgi:hypothetical protein
MDGDPDELDSVDGNTNSNHLGKRQTTGDGKPKSIFLPPEEWIHLKQERKDQLIAKCDQDHVYDKPFYFSYQTSIQQVEKFLNLKGIVEYTTIVLDVTQHDCKDPEDNLPDGISLVVCTDNHGHDTSHDKIWDFIAVILSTIKFKDTNAQTFPFAPTTFQFG